MDDYLVGKTGEDKWFQKKPELDELKQRLVERTGEFIPWELIGPFPTEELGFKKDGPANTFVQRTKKSLRVLTSAARFRLDMYTRFILDLCVFISIISRMTVFLSKFCLWSSYIHNLLENSGHIFRGRSQTWLLRNIFQLCW